MQRLTWLLKLLVQAVCFFALFAFALNNQHDVSVNFFFGTYWRGPLVLVVLAVFAAGVLLGALGLMPRWWRERQAAIESSPASDQTTGRSIGAAQTGPAQALGPGADGPGSEPVAPHGS